jgi:hypothetical protein
LSRQNGWDNWSGVDVGWGERRLVATVAIDLTRGGTMGIRNDQATRHVDLAGVEAGSELVIRTRNTEYRFVVIDPPARFGQLSGGACGESPQEAVLADVVREESARGGTRIQPGSRVRFHLFAEGRRKTLITSAVCELRTARSSTEETHFPSRGSPAARSVDASAAALS